VNPISLGLDIGGTTVKGAALRNGQILWTTRTRAYSRPDVQTLLGALREVMERLSDPVDHVGLCVPGILDGKRERITYAANLPGLSDLPLRELLGRAMGSGSFELSVVNDANATGFDIYSTRRPVGRLLVLAIGTGVGPSVLDDGKPLYVEGDSAGHLGQLDISLEEPAPIAPDGGRGGLEAYIGGGALAARYVDDPASRIRPGDLAFRALVRLVRVCHSFYRPQHICLAGGTGIRLAPLLPELRREIDDHLTSLARPGWTLFCGDSDFHAACGAARIAVTPDWK
jgi:predicted NBD/HSP70 family sugar kinase